MLYPSVVTLGVFSYLFKNQQDVADLVRFWITACRLLVKIFCITALLEHNSFIESFSIDIVDADKLEEHGD